MLGNTGLLDPTSFSDVLTSYHSPYVINPSDGKQNCPKESTDNIISNTEKDICTHSSKRSPLSESNNNLSLERETKNQANLDVSVSQNQSSARNGMSVCKPSNGLDKPSEVCCFCKNVKAKLRLQPCEHELCGQCASGSGRCVECGAMILNYEYLS